ncbi:BamA/TamA family outer membrane protein [Paraflavisolibacter sp. H34]|uniref:translocation and assembly module lipoprotein TamL n=1 Tax=Huijunlia imazamoxiresistens TaxID=3127457 RepID=UPI0030192E9C
MQQRLILVLSFVCSIATACNNTKYLPKDEKLYTGASVKVNSSGLTAKEKKVVRSSLQGLTRPKPNSSIFGLKPKLSIYNLFRNKKENSFWGKMRAKYGQPPVLLSDVDLVQNTKVLQSYLENRGFFHAKVTADTVVGARRAKAEYTAETGPQYTVNSVEWENDESQLASDISLDTAKSLLKPGAPYNLDLIKAERIRIDAGLKEKGYYFFGPDYLLIEVDSTRGDNKVDMRIVVKPETPVEALRAYRINKVYIYAGYNLQSSPTDSTKAATDTSRNRAIYYKGYYVIDRRNRYRPLLFSQAMQFNPGDVYNRTDHNLSLNRLINLNLFKFVKNRFEPLPDTPKLDAHYYLTPLPRKSLRAEITANTKSNNLNGTQLSVSWFNRNTFRAGEQLSITGYLGSEVQFGGTFQGYNTYRSGAEANLAIPRFAVPFTTIRSRGGYPPRTNIQLGYDLLTRQKLYTVNSYRAGLGYLWKENIEKQHEFYPISINYVQSLNVTPEFVDSIAKYPYLQRIVDKQFILGSTYQYNLNQLTTGIRKLNSFYFNGLVDLSGNIAGLVTGANVREGKQKRIFNTPFDQYIKMEVDGRYYRRIGLNSSWANRLVIGYGLPYGNSLALPYVKQFFAGGNNSIRAFRSRSLGPGTYRAPASNFLPDQTGDIKIEMSTEFRPRITGPLYGAIFLDAGNIWLANEDPTRPGGKFSKNFLKELAVGTGVGVRVDITMFVIRLDVGIPLVKPWEREPPRWQARVQEAQWRKDNIILNLAIGYPF